MTRTSCVWMAGALVLAGCMRDPDPGGQEGEEFGEWANGGDDVGAETGGDVEDATDSGGDGGVGATLVWMGEVGVEIGAATTPGEATCVYRWDTEGVASTQSCDSCLGVYAVDHTLNHARSSLGPTCPSLPSVFSATYGVVAGEGDQVSLVQLVGAEPEVLAEGALVGGNLTWSDGGRDVPDDSGDTTVYVTHVFTGDVTLD